MNEEQDLKLTDLDYLIGDHHLQMIKAALPYMNVPEQRLVSVFVKINELKRTMNLFNDEEVATMGICSLEKQKTSPFDMLNAVKAYGNTYEQEMIDRLSNFIQGFRLYHTFQENPAAGNDSGGGQNTFDQIKNMLSPEQQSKFETMQLMMQAMQQFT